MRTKNYGGKKNQRTCEVCGARLPYYRGLTTTTCDNTCTKAKHHGVSRAIEVEREVMQAGSFSGITSEHRNIASLVQRLDMGGLAPAVAILENLP